MKNNLPKFEINQEVRYEIRGIGCKNFIARKLWMPNEKGGGNWLYQVANSGEYFTENNLKSLEEDEDLESGKNAIFHPFHRPIGAAPSFDAGRLLRALALNGTVTPISETSTSEEA